MKKIAGNARRSKGGGGVTELPYAPRYLAQPNLLRYVNGAMGSSTVVQGSRFFGNFVGRSAAIAALCAVLSSCSMFATKPAGDLKKMSSSEASIAADLWQRQGRTREALEHALKALEYDDKNADAHHLTALLYLDFCRLSQIGECRLDEAEKHGRRAIVERDDFLEAQNTLAVILIHQKRYEEATKLLLPITQNMLYGTPEIAWGNLGWAYMQQGKHKLAIPALRRAVAAQPLFCVGSFRLGVAYSRTGAMESAVEALNRALNTDAPGCGALQDAYLERAQVHLAMGHIKDSRADLDRCIDLAKSTTVGRECNQLIASLD